FFQVKQIIVEREKNVVFTGVEKRLSELYLGRNIFRVDLDQLAEYLTKNFPQFKKVEVRRIMPDRIEIYTIVRMPVAYIDSGKGIFIDKDGYVSSVGGDPKGLVKIKGIKSLVKISNPGDKVRIGAMEKVILLIEVLKEKDFTKKYSVESVDAADKNNLVLNVNGISVKMGNDNFAGKVSKLGEILNDPSIKPEEISYVDLRFEKAVISPRS
ncbi:MAG TPA: FtsQ-type POTRA domain-containing protein, partial [Candidatus Omnitrophota bacterium]|nr:FtsQ-type POTRA domain-containing protein [Candidatus Omnitrophota bacterium]